MAKQTADRYTAEILGNRPGRPAKVDALNGAERARRYREKRKLFPVISVTRNEYCEWCGAKQLRCDACTWGSN